MYPDQHCQKVKEILQAEIGPRIISELYRAMAGKYVRMLSRLKMEKVLYTIDELTGLINATALMRPSKSILDTEVKSVKRNGNKKVLRQV